MCTTFRLVTVWAAGCGLLLTTLAAAAVTATPSTIVFNNHNESVLVALTHNGQRVMPDAVGAARFLVNTPDYTHDYAHMIEVSSTADGVLVSPSPRLEVGSYDLVIQTSHGPAHILVYAPLADLPSILDKAGPRLQALREEIGFSAETGRATVSIELPPVYIVGSTLSLTMPHDPQREYIWAMNGEIVHRGLGASTLEYSFQETGDYILTYAERLDGALVAYTQAVTRVTDPPFLPYAVPRATSPVFEAPEGYAEYRWEVDGELKAATRVFTMQFDRPGEHIVTLRATGPGRAPYTMRYRTVVE